MGVVETTASDAPLIPATIVRGPAMPRHEGWLEVDEYPTFWVKTWTNAPKRVFIALMSGDASQWLDAVHALILDVETRTSDGQTYDCWFDSDGDPLPMPSDPSFLDDVPTELLTITLLSIQNRAASILPNLLARAKSRSRAG